MRQIAAKLGIAPSKVSRLARVFEDPTLAAAIADGKITKSQAQELLVASTEEKPRLIELIAERRKADRPVSLSELRGAITNSRPHVALRNGRHRADPREVGVALRNTSLAPVVAAESDEPVHAGANIDVGPTDGVKNALSIARQQARTLRQRVEEQLPLLYASRHDPGVVAELTKVHEMLDHILRVDSDNDPACIPAFTVGKEPQM